jgi:hypothetical protein
MENLSFLPSEILIQFIRIVQFLHRFLSGFLHLADLLTKLSLNFAVLFSLKDELSQVFLVNTSESRIVEDW